MTYDQKKSLCSCSFFHVKKSDPYWNFSFIHDSSKTDFSWINFSFFEGGVDRSRHLFLNAGLSPVGHLKLISFNGGGVMLCFFEQNCFRGKCLTSHCVAHDAILAFDSPLNLCLKRPTSLFALETHTFHFSNPLGVIRYREPVPPPTSFHGVFVLPIGPDMIRWKKVRPATRLLFSDDDNLQPGVELSSQLITANQHPRTHTFFPQSFPS